MSRERKTIAYAGRHFNKAEVFKLMVALTKSGFEPTLVCRGSEQWEFKIFNFDENESVSGIGFGAFRAAKACFWNWKNCGFCKE